MGTAAPKEGGKHEAEDFPQELLLGSQAAFDLDDEVIRQAYVVEGLVQGFDIALGLALLVLMAFFRLQTTACDGFGVLFDVSFGKGHGALLDAVWGLCTKTPSFPQSFVQERILHKKPQANFIRALSG